LLAHSDGLALRLLSAQEVVVRLSRLDQADGQATPVSYRDPSADAGHKRLPVTSRLSRNVTTA